MMTCTICHFDTVLDDIVLSRADGQCVCLSCFGRETGSSRPMPKALRRELSAALSSL
jgi:hypothetical protein